MMNDKLRGAPTSRGKTWPEDLSKNKYKNRLRVVRPL